MRLGLSLKMLERSYFKYDRENLKDEVLISRLTRLCLLRDDAKFATALRRSMQSLEKNSVVLLRPQA